MKHVCLAAIAAAILALSFPTPSQAEDANEHEFARDIKILTKWFEGHFDNEEQLWLHGRSRAKGEKPLRIHTVHIRLDLPDFGEHVFYVEEYQNNDPSDIIRQRFVTFEPDVEAGAIRMQQGFLKKGERYLGKYEDPAAFANLKKKDIFFMKDLAPDNQCDVFWTRHLDQYEGKMVDKGCQLGTDGNGPPRYSVHNLSLSAEKYWRVDSSFLTADDSLHIGTPIDKPTRMRRAAMFQCQGTFRTGDKAQEFGPIPLHNQGGTAQITREADGQAFDLLLRKKEYPFYETRPDFLYFSLREAGAPRSLVYTVSDIDARRLGVTFSGIAIHCHRSGYTFRETLEQLD